MIRTTKTITSSRKLSDAEERELWDRFDSVMAKADEMFAEADKLFKAHSS